MSRYATEQGGGGFKPEFGIHNVVCCQLVDFGTQETEWQGKITGKAPFVNIGFEFVDIDLQNDGEKYHPVWGIKERCSLGKESNLRKLLEGWRGKQFTEDELKGFDLDKLLGLPCQLVVGPNTKGNPKVTAIVHCKTQLKGLREPHSFWFDENFSGDLPEWLPEWMQEIIQQSDEFLGINENEGNSEDVPFPADVPQTEDDDIPF